MTNHQSTDYRVVAPEVAIAVLVYEYGMSSSEALIMGQSGPWRRSAEAMSSSNDPHHQTTPWTVCDFCAPDGTIMNGRMLCPICDGAKGYDPTPLPPDNPLRQAQEAIATWRREWAAHDATLLGKTS